MVQATGVVMSGKPLKMSVGERVEDLYCNGLQPGAALDTDERSQIAQWAARFEECAYTRSELDAMSDVDLVAAAYGAMADYAHSQM